MTEPLRIAIAGLGTVGAGTVKVLREHADLLAGRCGRPLEVVAVSARDRDRDRGVDLSGYAWYDDAATMAAEAPCDVVVELIGGEGGMAHAVCETALRRGRHVVTANKALLAHHGPALARTAGETGAALAYEAAVAGGIPAVKGVREGLAGNRIDAVTGILNGTCNFILTKMRNEGRDFDDVLKEAQDLGYAEADPGVDVDGTDAAHKAALLAAVAYGTPVDFDAIPVEGIRRISSLDIHYAEELGYRIKLLGLARRAGDGLEVRVSPYMVPLSAPLAHIEDVTNAVAVEGDAIGRAVFEGPGAGQGPTASAVVADLVDIARGNMPPVFGTGLDTMQPQRILTADERRGPAYVRLMVVDRAGVFAEIAAALRDEGVSMEAVLQHGRNPGETVPVVLTLHETDQAALRRVLDRINSLDAVVEPPMMLPIEPL